MPRSAAQRHHRRAAPKQRFLAIYDEEMLSRRSWDEPGYAYRVINAKDQASAEKIAHKKHPDNDFDVVKLKKRENPEKRFYHEIAYYGTIED
jgi:hypothetical protein